LKEGLVAGQCISKLEDKLVINSEELMDRLEGDRALLSELLGFFRRDYPGQIRAARQALSRAEAEGVERAGHALKGILANLSAIVACRLAARLEEMGRTRDLAHADSTLAELEQELSRVTASLDLLCEGVAR